MLCLLLCVLHYDVIACNDVTHCIIFRRRDNGQKDQRLSPSTPSTPKEGPRKGDGGVNKIYTEQDVAKIMTRAYDPGK